MVYSIHGETLIKLRNIMIVKNVVVQLIDISLEFPMKIAEFNPSTPNYRCIKIIMIENYKGKKKKPK